MKPGTSFSTNEGLTFYVDLCNEAGDPIIAHGATVPSDAAVGFAKGCIFIKTNGGVATTAYINEGTTASADFNAVESSASTVTGVVAGNGLTGGGTEGSVTLAVDVDGATIEINADKVRVKDAGITTAKIADGAVTAKKLVGSEARTATAAGLTTGAITPPTAFRTFVTVTSGAATDQIALPAITADTIGQEIFVTVGANGFELITPASSNNTINQVDSDGTNQMDVAANTTVRCTQISATAWLAETVAATTIAVTAPDND